MRLAAVSALLTLTLLAGCGVGEAKLEAEQQAAAPLPVDSVAAGLADLYASYHATSLLAADGEAQVPARIAGQVVEILVEEGDRVIQGQVLARLDGERLRLKAQQSAAEFRKRSNELERQQDLHRRGIVSSAAFETLQYEVEALAAAWELDQLNYSYAEIRAPITGVVSARGVKIGEQVGPGHVAFVISDTSRLLTELAIPQTELARFRTGLPLTIRADALGERSFAARIDRISPTIDRSTGTFRVTSYIDNGDGALAPGMFARVSVQYEKHENALSVPADAVVEEDGQFVVYVVSGGVAERRVIEPGIRAQGRVEVLAGLHAGEQVIHSGTGGLRDGTRVVAMQALPTPVGG